MENVETVVAVVSAVLVLMTYVTNSYKKLKALNKKEDIDLACKIVEEAVVTAEIETADNKNRAKDIKLRKDAQKALKLVRKQAHEIASSLIGEIATKSGNKKVAKVFNLDVIDAAIRLAVQIPKMNGMNPLVSLFNRRF